MLPWAEIMSVAVLVLETLHKSRPWHTAVLAVALTGYLLAVHLAETDAGVSVLRAQLPLLGAGLGLTALAVGRGSHARAAGRAGNGAHQDSRGRARRHRGGAGHPGLARPRALTGYLPAA